MEEFKHSIMTTSGKFFQKNFYVDHKNKKGVARKPPPPLVKTLSFNACLPRTSALPEYRFQYPLFLQYTYQYSSYQSEYYYLIQL